MKKKHWCQAWSGATDVFLNSATGLRTPVTQRSELNSPCLENLEHHQQVGNAHIIVNRMNFLLDR